MSFRLNSQKNVPANNCRYNIMVVLELPASSRVGFMVSTKPGIHAFKMYGLPTLFFHCQVDQREAVLYKVTEDL